MFLTGCSTKIDTTICSSKVNELKARFASRIVGQPDATDALVRVLENQQGGFADPRRPLGSLLFLGPTGTGKTSSVEAMCEGLFGFRDAMVKIDCGEFEHSHEIAKLIGSPPGYLGHRETPPRLTQEALNSYQTAEFPMNIVLFDEIEKASDALWQLLLGVLDKGLLTLGDNAVTNFTKSVIVLTSNVGASQMATMLGENPLGYAVERNFSNKKLKDVAMSAARKKFSPEFLNRLDEIVMFNTLTKDQVQEIMGLELGYLQSKLFSKNGSRLCPSPAALREIIAQGFDEKYNARNLRRVIEKKIMLPIARAISTKQIGRTDTIVVDAKDGEFVFYTEKIESIKSAAASMLSSGQLQVPTPGLWVA